MTVNDMNMKTAKKILKMTKDDLEKYKWSSDLDVKIDDNCCSFCSDCSHCSHCLHCSRCSDCSHCSFCSDCSDCYLCRNTKGLRYAICNVVLGKETYEKKMKELAESK